MVFPPQGLAGAVRASKHTEDQAVLKGTTYVAVGYNYYEIFANGTTITSVSITTTKPTLALIIASLSLLYNHAHTSAFNIERDGVDKTADRLQSGFDGSDNNVLLLWALERLEIGTYTYTLVNRTGSDAYVFGASIKIIAVEP